MVQQNHTSVGGLVVKSIVAILLYRWAPGSIPGRRSFAEFVEWYNFLAFCTFAWERRRGCVVHPLPGAEQTAEVLSAATALFFPHATRLPSTSSVSAR
jgi:hypothetical protein